MQSLSKRQVLIFGKPKSIEVLQQISILDKEKAGTAERDMTITLVPKGDSRYTKYKADTASFTVVLIGKDGGEKYRSKSLVTAKQFFDIVDAMPMRKSEMRRQ